MALPRERLPQDWLTQIARPVHPEEMTAEDSFAYAQFLRRVRSFVLLKAAVNVLLVVLFLLTVMPESPGVVLVALADGLLLVPYYFLAKRWPALSTIGLLSLTAVAISAADIAFGSQTSTSGVLYAGLIVAGAVLLLHPRNIIVITATITFVFLCTYILEIARVIPVTMALQSSRAIIRVMALHIVTFLGLGAMSGVLTRPYRQLLAVRSQQDRQQALQSEVALGRIGQEIASHLRMSELVPAIYQHIRHVMDAPSFLIALTRNDRSGLELLSPIDVGQVVPDQIVPSQGVLGWVVRKQRPLRFGDMQREVRAYPEIRIQPLGTGTFIPGSLLAVPLLIGDQVVGALSVQSPKSHAYDQRDEHFLLALASHVAAAVRNARLYDEVQQKQTELQGLISAVSQRLQGPVEALAGFGRLLRETAPQDSLAEQNDYLERLERNSRWVSQLTQDMLFLSRLDQVKEEQEPIALGTLVRGVVTHLELEQQGIGVTIQEEMPTLYADPVLLWAYFRNLLQNACRLLRGSDAPQIEVGCTTLPEGYCLHVQESGQALPPEALQHAFDLFFPIGEPEGAGIGLAIAQRIAQHYGGRVWADAAAGHGTTFYLLLPQTLGKTVRALP